MADEKIKIYPTKTLPRKKILGIGENMALFNYRDMSIDA